ncbi:flagellar hook-length control protein FliK [Glutamicibacter creatinolyticus]|uniref:flagellar hook-length control protein FliK n=1 Tax=Glutamicibacter creatinolyticus TaxID=162496 RepID=UPI0036F480A7
MDPINMAFSAATSGAGPASASSAGATAAGAKAAGEFAQLVDRLLAESRESVPADRPAANGFGAQAEAAAGPGAAATVPASGLEEERLSAADTPQQPSPAVLAMPQASATQSIQASKTAFRAAGATVGVAEPVSAPVVATEEVTARGAGAAQAHQQSLPSASESSQSAPRQATSMQAPPPLAGDGVRPSVAQVPRLEVLAPQAKTQRPLLAQNLRMVVNWPPSGQQPVNGGQSPAIPDHLPMEEPSLLLIDASQNPAGPGNVEQSAATKLAVLAAEAPAAFVVGLAVDSAPPVADNSAETAAGDAAPKLAGIGVEVLPRDAASVDTAAMPAQSVQASTAQPASTTTAETSGQQVPAASLPLAAVPTVTVEAAPPTAPAALSEAARTATPVPALHRQLFAPISTLAVTPHGERMLSVKVAPDSLGPITVTAQLGGDGLRVDLTASTDAGRDALRAMLPELRRELAATGHASLSINTADADGAQQGGDTSRQGFGERPAPRTTPTAITGTTASPSEHEPRTRSVPGNPSGLDVMA